MSGLCWGCTARKPKKPSYDKHHAGFYTGLDSGCASRISLGGIGLLTLDLGCDWGRGLALDTLVGPNSANYYQSIERYNWSSVHADVWSLETPRSALGVFDAVFHVDWFVRFHSSHEYLAND